MNGFRTAELLRSIGTSFEERFGLKSSSRMCRPYGTWSLFCRPPSAEALGYNSVVPKEHRALFSAFLKRRP